MDTVGQSQKEMSNSQETKVDSAVDFDDARLTQMGYRPELDRKFSLLSCLAVGFSVSPHPSLETGLVMHIKYQHG